MAIASGMADVVLVVGGEIMRKVTGWNATDIVATMLHTEAEYNMGLTLPGFGGMDKWQRIGGLALLVGGGGLTYLLAMLAMGFRPRDLRGQ